MSPARSLPVKNDADTPAAESWKNCRRLRCRRSRNHWCECGLRCMNRWNLSYALMVPSLVVEHEINFVIKRPQQVLGLLRAVARFQVRERLCLLRVGGEAR